VTGDQLELSWASYKKHGPETSREAAMLVEGSGKAAGQRRMLWRAVTVHPGCTAPEIAALIGIDRYDASRRLPELRDKLHVVRNGEARVCKELGTNQNTWWAVEDAPADFGNVWDD